ncbi:hypothetical protein FMEXI_6537 [Fusarium mexicanum]|uniref:Uncharacterized protein n=1 Tax=Fusarium mexicanum TaxID=751941 RepID=A0A8H5IWK5_9HYPO|nr:hypothetical protein FMEXI_6537 [Fusarium mexicanum]
MHICSLSSNRASVFTSTRTGIHQGRPHSPTSISQDMANTPSPPDTQQANKRQDPTRSHTPESRVVNPPRLPYTKNSTMPMPTKHILVKPYSLSLTQYRKYTQDASP